MKANITCDGILEIIPESSLEAYALRRWNEKYSCVADHGGESVLKVYTEVTKDEHQTN